MRRDRTVYGRKVIMKYLGNGAKKEKGAVAKRKVLRQP